MVGKVRDLTNFNFIFFRSNVLNILSTLNLPPECIFIWFNLWNSTVNQYYSENLISLQFDRFIISIVTTTLILCVDGFPPASFSLWLP